MSWLKGGPFLEVSFLQILNVDRRSLATGLIERLENSIDNFRLAIDSDGLNDLINQFEKGYPFDEEDPSSHMIHLLEVPIWVEIAGKRKSILSLEQISNNLLAAAFWFYGAEWDEPEWNQIGISEQQIEDFKKFLSNLFEIIKFPIGVIQMENDVKGIFNTNEGWPHESYNLRNINVDWINSYIMAIVKKGFLPVDSLNILREENDGIIVQQVL